MRLRAVLAALLVAGASISAHAAYDRSKLHPVYQEKSLYRNILVLEGGGYRCITFGRYHGEQSCIELAQPGRMVIPYTKGLLSAFYAASAPRRVLVVGLGGGVLPRAIRDAFPQVEIDSVELDPAVARVAGSHFGFTPDARSRVYVDDGRVFVRKQKRAGVRYDIILMDAFEKDYIPEHMLTREFLAEVRSILQPGGVVAANTFADGELQALEAATYQSVFGAVVDVEMDGGNRIILAGSDGLPSMEKMRATAAALDARIAPLGFDSGYLLPRFKPQPPAKGARVLTDQFAPSNLLLRLRH